MGKKVITMSLSEKSIQNAIQELRAYTDSEGGVWIMAGNQWVFDLETNIFSNVVTIAKPKLQKKYKSMNFDTAFTTVEKSD